MLTLNSTYNQNIKHYYREDNCGSKIRLDLLGIIKTGRQSSLPHPFQIMTCFTLSNVFQEHFLRDLHSDFEKYREKQNYLLQDILQPVTPQYR